MRVPSLACYENNTVTTTTSTTFLCASPLPSGVAFTFSSGPFNHFINLFPVLCPAQDHTCLLAHASGAYQPALFTTNTHLTTPLSFDIISPWPTWTPTTLTSVATKVRFSHTHPSNQAVTPTCTTQLECAERSWASVPCNDTSNCTRRHSLTNPLPDERDYPPRDRSRSPGQERDRDGDVRLRDEPSNGRHERYALLPLHYRRSRANMLAAAHQLASAAASTTTTKNRSTLAPTSSSPASIPASPRMRSLASSRSTAKSRSATLCVIHTLARAVASASSRWSPQRRPTPPRRNCRVRSTKAEL